MRCIKKIAVSCLIASTVLTGLITLAQAADRPNVIVFNENYDNDTLSSNSRIHKQVLRAVDNQLGDRGIATYDEVAVGLDQRFAAGRTRRSDAQIIENARLIKAPPIDVAVIYSIYASTQPLGYITKVRIRIEVRMLEVKTGQNLGSFQEVSPEDKDWTLPADCKRECTLEKVGEYANILGNRLGAVLGEELAWMVDGRGRQGSNSGEGVPMAYKLNFNGFSSSDMLEIEKYLVAIFSGYKSHRPIYSSERRSKIWYESSISSAKLTQNLNRMLDELNLRGTVEFSGNTVSIEKIMLRGCEQISNRDYTW